jgi:hypothetical protein
MDTEEIEEFFSNIDLKGSNYKRAETVVSYLKSRSDCQDSDFLCMVGSSGSSACSCSLDGDFLKFENNGRQVRIGKLKEQQKIENFKGKVILAIDSAELKGGSLKDKRDRFEDVFPGEVNVVVYNKANLGTYFTYSWGCFHSETRDETTYEAWLTG